MPNATTPTASPVAQNPLNLVRNRADALYRGAIECCRQHDRAAKISRADEPELENRHADDLCRMCDSSLAELAEAYISVAASHQPPPDESWWQKANALWHSSREYARRLAGSDAMGKRISGKHSAEHLAGMQMEYELEASSLLALRHAAESYRRTRPDLAL